MPFSSLQMKHCFFWSYGQVSSDLALSATRLGCERTPAGLSNAANPRGSCTRVRTSRPNGNLSKKWGGRVAHLVIVEAKGNALLLA